MLLWFSICGMAPAVMAAPFATKNKRKEGIPVLRNVASQECAES